MVFPLTPSSSSSYRSIAKLCLSSVERVIKAWKTSIPYVHPFYAVKSNPNNELIDLLHSHDFGFDCASKQEIEVAKKRTTKIVFGNPTKSVNDIKYSCQNNVHDYVVDSIEEVKKIRSIDSAAKYIIRVLGYEQNSLMKFNKKFGASVHDAKTMLSYMRDNNLSFRGYSYHVGSKCKDMSSHEYTINTILSKYKMISDACELKTQTIDIGGGFENIQDIQRLGVLFREKEYLRQFEREGIELIAEPGRIISSPSINLLTKVIATRRRIIDGKEVYYITINDSLYHTFQGKMFDHQEFTPIPLYCTSQCERPHVTCVIFGQTCDSLDIICDRVILPLPMIDDVIMFKNMGAYSLASATGTFNGFEAAATCMQ
jgi:ornithine decarboxylase